MHMEHPTVSRLGYTVDADGGERLTYAGMELVIRASADMTSGAFGIVEEIDAVEAPPHVHEKEDELFFVLEGRHAFTVGDIEYEADPGDLVIGPRGIPHSQRHISTSGRTLTIFSCAAPDPCAIHLSWSCPIVLNSSSCSSNLTDRADSRASPSGARASRPRC